MYRLFLWGLEQIPEKKGISSCPAKVIACEKVLSFFFVSIPLDWKVNAVVDVTKEAALSLDLKLSAVVCFQYYLHNGEIGIHIGIPTSRLIVWPIKVYTLIDQ